MKWYEEPPSSVLGEPITVWSPIYYNIKGIVRRGDDPDWDYMISAPEDELKAIVLEYINGGKFFMTPFDQYMSLKSFYILPYDWHQMFYIKYRRALEIDSMKKEYFRIHGKHKEGEPFTPYVSM
jgi:hypothetical protein